MTNVAKKVIYRKLSFLFTESQISLLRKLSKHHGISQEKVMQEALKEKAAADLNV